MRWVACWQCTDEQSQAGLRREDPVPTIKLRARKAAHIREDEGTIHSRGRADVLPGARLSHAAKDGDLLSRRLRLSPVEASKRKWRSPAAARTELKAQKLPE